MARMISSSLDLGILSFKLGISFPYCSGFHSSVQTSGNSLRLCKLLLANLMHSILFQAVKLTWVSYCFLSKRKQLRENLTALSAGNRQPGEPARASLGLQALVSLPPSTSYFHL